MLAAGVTGGESKRLEERVGPRQIDVEQGQGDGRRAQQLLVRGRAEDDGEVEPEREEEQVEVADLARRFLRRRVALGTFQKGEVSREEILEMMSGGRELAELGAELEEFARADADKDPAAATEAALARSLQDEARKVHH